MKDLATEKCHDFKTAFELLTWFDATVKKERRTIMDSQGWLDEQYNTWYTETRNAILHHMVDVSFEFAMSVEDSADTST